MPVLSEDQQSKSKQGPENPVSYYGKDDYGASGKKIKVVQNPKVVSSIGRLFKSITEAIEEEKQMEQEAGKQISQKVESVDPAAKAAAKEIYRTPHVILY